MSSKKTWPFGSIPADDAEDAKFTALLTFAVVVGTGQPTTLKALAMAHHRGNATAHSAKNISFSRNR